MLIRKVGEAVWHAPETTSYPDEMAIQSLLTQSPDLMPGGDGQRFAVATEVGVEAGYADIIAVTPDGEITLIECKLRVNPGIRREIIGQIFAYAASMWEMDYAAFDTAFAARVKRSLADAVAAVAGDEWDEEMFRAAVTDNLALGRFRLIVAVDEITDELRRTVRFLNRHSSTDLEILALELRYVADSGVEILFPTIYGEESAAAKPAKHTEHWDEARFFTAINAAMSRTGIDATRKLYDFALSRGATITWGGSSYPSVTAKLLAQGQHVRVFSLQQWGSEGARLYMYFRFLAGKVSRETLEMLASDLRQIPEMSGQMRDLEAKGYKKEPWVLLDHLSSDSLTQIEAALDRLLSA